MARDSILHKVRTALGRTVGQPPALPPDLYFQPPQLDREERVEAFRVALEALAGKVFVARSGAEAREYVAAQVAGKTAVASRASYLAECGVTSLAGVNTRWSTREELRALCAGCDFGISSADYALANTGTLVTIASPEEQRLVSLLPPVHIAVVPVGRLLASLEELFLTVPKPADRSSSMVFITGPSRTADIEQILVRGVHGPGEIHVVLVNS